MNVRHIATVSPVVFLLVGILAQLVTAQGAGPAQFRANAVIGGPSPVYAPHDDVGAEAALENLSRADGAPLIGGDEGAEELEFAGTAVESSANPHGSALTRGGITVYRVQEGDTLTHIAQNFGISLNTILWANPGLKGNLIRIGQEIFVLPASGVQHRVEGGETLASIANLYAIPEAEIIRVNPRIAEGVLAPDDKIVIPGGRPIVNASALASARSLPNLGGYFALPAAGWNWGQIHAENAVDIANACGTPLYAAAEGLVVSMGNPANWNSGYGGYIDLEHPNGTGTRYAHTQKNLVAIGDYVEQGEMIAEMGNTGNTRGVTSCHLHFEVRGARNPLAK